jgi:hypothetical protein
MLDGRNIPCLAKIYGKFITRRRKFGPDKFFTMAELNV